MSDSILDGWPAHESRHVETRFGTTRVVVSGPLSGPPLVLIGGLNGGGAITWFANIAELSRAHRVYAVDTVGAAGGSSAGERMRTAPDTTDWLDEVADGLGLRTADWMGHGHGAWLLMELAIRRPQRVRKVILLDPPNALVGLAMSKIAPAIFPSLFPAPDRMRPLLLGAGERTPAADAWVAVVCLGMRKYKSARHAAARIITDARLRELAAPTLLLMGQDSPSSGVAAVHRAQRLIPQITADVLPRTGHVVMVERAAEVNRRVLKFLELD